MRVDMIILEYHPIVGGAQRQLALVAPRLQAAGVAVRILTRRYPGLPAHETIAGVPVHRLPAPGPKPMAALAFSLAALGKIRQRPPDLIHAYSLFSPLTTAVWAKKRLGLPVVAKVLRGGPQGDVDRLRHKPLGGRRLAAYRRQVDAFVTISREIDAELAALGVPSSRRVFVPNGVDLDRFYPASPATRRDLRRQLQLPDGPLVLFTGRLAPEKQVDRLVSMWPAVRRHHAAANLLILGDGPEAAALRRQAGTGVLFGGRVDDVHTYLRAADLFVLPSATEGLSNSLLEAMAAGLPVVATAVGGAPDIIEHSQSGWLVSPDSLPDMKATVISLLGDTARQQALGDRARQKMVAEYGLDSVAAALVGLYTAVLEGSKV